MSKLNEILSSSHLPEKSLVQKLATCDELSAIDLVLMSHEDKARRLSDYARSMGSGGETFNKETAVDILVQIEILATACVGAFDHFCQNDKGSPLAKKLSSMIQRIDVTQRLAIESIRVPLEMHFDLMHQPRETMGRIHTDLVSGDLKPQGQQLRTQA